MFLFSRLLATSIFSKHVVRRVFVHVQSAAFDGNYSERRALECTERLLWSLR